LQHVVEHLWGVDSDATHSMHQVTSPKVAPGDARETPCDGYATSGRHLLNVSLAAHRYLAEKVNQW